MTEPDAVFSKLAELSAPAPDPALSARITRLAHARLRPRPLARGYYVAVAACALSYLGWALQFVVHISQ